jgi:hypothetical protein
MPAASAGVGPPLAGGRRAWGVHKLSTVPMSYMPCGSVSVRRASARPRRVSAVRRSRHGALRRAMAAVLLTPSPCARRRSVSTRAGGPSTRRHAVAPTRRRSERLTPWASKTWRHRRRRGRPPGPVCPGSRKVSRMARMEDTTPSVQPKRGRRAAPRLTRASRRRLRGLARCALPSPPHHKRVVTIRASALHTRPPCFCTRLSSACPCPRARGGATTSSWTACPCRPERAHQSATVRSSQPQAAPIAGTGHPWARKVTTRPTVSAEGAQPGEDCAWRGAARLMARGTMAPLGFACVDTHVALADLASGRAREMGAAYGGGVHDLPPGVAGEHAQEEYGWTPIFFTSEPHHSLMGSYRIPCCSRTIAAMRRSFVPMRRWCVRNWR